MRRADVFEHRQLSAVDIEGMADMLDSNRLERNQ